MALKPLILPVSEFAPDMPDYRDEASSNAMNVIPRTPKSYGPLAAPSIYSNALKKKCQGAYFGVDSGGNINGFAGDANDLYNLTVSSTGWTIVSSSPGAYSIASSDLWQFCLFGINVIATDYADAIQSFTLGTSTAFAALAAAAPKARFACVSKSFLVVADTNDPVFGQQHQRVWWCANGDPTNWPTPGSALAAQYESDFQDLLGDGGFIKGIVGNLGNADLLIFQERAVFRGVWVGGPNVFDFFPMEGVRGCPASGSIAQLGGVVYYLAQDGFYVNDGGQSIPIGANKVDKTFYADLDQNYFGSISAAIDPFNKLYIVFYPGAGHAGSNCNKMLIYNWQLQRWSEAIPFANGGELIARALSFGYTLDQLYTVLGYFLDTLPAPLDSRLWTADNVLLGAFDSNHALNAFTGAPLPATVDTSEFQATDGMVTKFINTKPIVDGNVIPSVSLGVRNRQVDTPSFGTPIAMDALGNSPQRAVGRYARARITIPSSSSWTNISGVELEGVPAGVRY